MLNKFYSTIASIFSRKNLSINRYLVVLSLGLFGQTTFAQYCTPTYNNLSCISDDYIDGVALNTLSNLGTACATDGANYSDFTAISTSLTQGSTYSITITPTTAYEQSASVYIDFNQDQVFDASELVFFGGPSISAYSGNVTIPGTAMTGSTRMRVRGEYSASAASDPCALLDYGETEDYTINILAGANCAGLPTASNTLASDDSVCIGSLVDFSLDFTYSGVGISYQWQSSANGSTWSNIVGANNAAYSVNILAAGYYRCAITCAFGSTTYSTPVQVYLNNFLTCYCTAYNPACFAPDYISNVMISGTTLNNTSACSSSATSNYTNYAATVAAPNLVQGLTYSLSVTTESDNIISVWIDFNQDGVYDASEWTQVATTSTASTPNTITISIPPTATLGQTGMRVRSRGTGNQNDAIDACTGFGSGETEDYLVNIISAVPCNGSPATANALTSDASVCPNANFSLSLSTVYSNTGISYQWQSSPTGTTYTDIVGATDPLYTTTQASANYYQCVITCATGSSTTSAPILVNMNGSLDCYCQPEYGNSSCGSGDYIDSVYFNTISNGPTGCAVSGSNYSDYTNLSTNIIQGMTYNIAIKPEDVYGQAATVFIDYNQDGVYDPATEMVFFNTASTSIMTGTIMIPATATLGETRMRVRGVYNETTPSDPCTAYDYGETEDYKLYILSSSPTPDVAISSVIAPNNACAFGANEIVEVVLSNSGNTVLAAGDVSVTLTYSGANTGSATMTNATTLGVGGSETIIFTPVNLSNVGTTNFNATATLTGDTNPNNNLLTATSTSYGTASVSQTLSVCQGGSITVGNSVYSAAGTYTDVLTTAMGCDSIVTTVLTVTPAPSDTTYTGICEGGSIVINGVTYTPTTTTTYNYTTSNAAGCDSIHYVVVNIYTIIMNNLPDSVYTCNCATLDATTVGTAFYNWSNGANTSTIQACSSGYYYVSVTNSMGCAAFDTAYVQVLPALSASASGMQLNLLADVAFTATATGAAPITYSWNFGDGGTSNQQNPQHTYPPVNTVYPVSVTINSPCGDTTISFSQEIVIVALDASSLQANIAVYPNPNNGVFTVSSDDITANQVWIELFDLQGKVVYQATEKITNGLQYQVNTQSMSKGIYLLKVGNGESVAYRKVIIE